MSDRTNNSWIKEILKAKNLGAISAEEADEALKAISPKICNSCGNIRKNAGDGCFKCESEVAVC